MKIAHPVRVAFENSAEVYSRLQQEVLAILKPQVEEQGWFFSHRTKSMESFAQKVETGRVPDPRRMEDYFACTIVVPTATQLAAAEALVLALFDMSTRRPACESVTHKRSSSFEFDDLRLYVQRRPSDTGKNEDLSGLIFEVQVKTMLQYAWSVATHDLVYKAKSVSWALERIAFQVKAMLESAEVTIAEAVAMAETPSLAKADPRTQELTEIIDQIEAFWPEDRLPDDLKRLAENIAGLLHACDVGHSDLPRIWEDEKARLGILPVDLSPYAFTVQALSQNGELGFVAKFRRDNVRTRIAIHSDMDIPPELQEEHVRVVHLR